MRTSCVAKFDELHFVLLPEAPYSLDLTPCDYFLFPNLKKFSSDDEIIIETNVYCAELDKSHYTEA